MSREEASDAEPVFSDTEKGPTNRTPADERISSSDAAGAAVHTHVPSPLPFLGAATSAAECSTPATLSAGAAPSGQGATAFLIADNSMDEPLATDLSITKAKAVPGATGALGNCLVKNVQSEPSSHKDDDISLDSYGIPRYEVRYPGGGRGSRGDVSVPWNLRPSHRRLNCTFFDSLRSPQFWRQFEFATRITAVAILVPGALIAAGLPNDPFVSTFMVFSSTVLAAKRTSGEAVAYVFNWARAGVFWLPLAAIAGALNLGHHMVGWCIYYTFCLFIMATFTDGIVRRICLLLFNSCSVGLLVKPERNALFPCRVMVDWCIGTGLCVVAAFFPYPLFCKREAQRLLRGIARNTATAYRGLVYSFWSPSNVERNMAMSKVNLMTESLDELLPLFEHYQSFSFYEVFFETSEVRDIRALKFQFFERLRINLSSMTRVLDMVEAKPSAIDDSERSKAFGEMLNPHLNAVAEAFDELLDLLAHAKTRTALMDLHERFTYFADRTDDLQDAYKLARRILFYEHTSDVLEGFVPLMSFYLFTVMCVRDTVNIFTMKVRGYKPSAVASMKQILMKTAWEPFVENIDFLKTLFRRWNRREIQRVVEAAKVSGAMILTIGFSYLIKVDKNSFSGPNIIAFVSGSNPVEAVQESIVRLTGCLLGTVLGFFAGTYSHTPVQRVASLCTLMFCGTFLRFDKEYGVMAVYGMFVLIPLDSVTETTIEDTVQRMNQNTFGIFIYLFVSALVLPLSPSLILRAKRVNVLRCMSSTVTSMMNLFSTPLVSDRSSTFRAQRDDTNDDPLSNRSIHMIPKADEAMREIDKQLADILRRLKGTKDMMRFARDERTLVEVDYPIKSCEQTYSHMYRMSMLLKTMWMSWSVIRSQHSYTSDTRHMMRNLQPIALDIAGAFQRFVDLMCCMMREPAINLEGNVMKTVLDLIEACDVLHRRKSQIMLMLINQSVHNYVENLDPSDPSFRREEVAANQHLNPEPVIRSHSTIAVPSHAGGAGGEVDRGHRQHSGQDFQCPTAQSSRLSRGSCLPRSNTYDQGFDHFAPFTPVGSPSTLGFNFQVFASECNVSVPPFLPKPGQESTRMHACSPTGPVRLPSNFCFPVTSEDAEGMHSFTLSLEMFANEAKLLMMSIGVMLDNVRSKM